MDDEILMARFAAGHSEAFAQIYDRYEEPIYSFCLRFLGERDAADDAFQDTFVALVEQRAQYRDRGRFRSWLFTLARNVCADRTRRSARRARLLTLRPVGDAPSAGEPEKVFELRDELTRLLSSLSPEHREVLLLHRYEGFSYSEIAQMTSSTEVAIKQKAYRALTELRSRHRDEGEAEGGVQ